MKTLIWTEPGHAWLVNEFAYVKRELQRQKVEGMSRTYTRTASPNRLNDRFAEQHAAAISEDRRIRLENLLCQVRPCPMVPLSSVASFGQMITVTIEDEEGEKSERTFVLGGVDESIVQLSYEVISCTSPLGRAVLGKQVGVETEYVANKHTRCATITAITEPPPIEPRTLSKAA